MKKLTVLLTIVVLMIFGVRCLQEPARRAEEERLAQEREAIIAENKLFGRGGNTHNKQLAVFAGVKVRGSQVKTLFSLVETCNEQEIFPTIIRYGDVVPGSYEWTTTIAENINSGDSIQDSAYYEVVMQNQLEDDWYLDTITIRPYSENYRIDQSKSGE